MKRFHVHVAVDNLEQSIGFYSKLFGADPTVLKPDYAKWMLEDPRVNFAISTRGARSGVDHLGIQAEDEHELEQLHTRIASAATPLARQQDAVCCYARSNKYWTVDPQGIAWESFRTLSEAPLYGEAATRRLQAQPAQAQAACCAPATAPQTQARSACCA